jgi:hypothetical protein
MTDSACLHPPRLRWMPIVCWLFVVAGGGGVVGAATDTAVIASSPATAPSISPAASSAASASAASSADAAWALAQDQVAWVSTDGGVQTAFTIGSGTVTIQLDDPRLAVGLPNLHAWVRKAAQALVGFFGHYPVPAVRIMLTVRGEAGPHHGVTFAGRLIHIDLGADTQLADLREDWVCTHEMFHLTFPDLAERHLWLEEGLATYLEPLARARVGNLPVDEVWRQLVEGLPKGEPAAGDAGLEATHTWGRTYWGGCLFCLQADLAIRDQTAGVSSLDTALQAILAAGGDGSQHWRIDRVLRLADQTTHTSVLQDLFSQEGSHPVAVDLAALWRKLGVDEQDRRMVYDDHAPWATLRRSMTAPVPVVWPLAVDVSAPATPAHSPATPPVSPAAPATGP